MGSLRQSSLFQRIIETKGAGYRPLLKRMFETAGRQSGFPHSGERLRRGTTGRPGGLESFPQRACNSTPRSTILARRPIASRSPGEANERGANGDRRSTHYSAWESRKRTTPRGAERRRLPPRQGGSRHAGTRDVTDAAPPALSRPPDVGPRRLPAPHGRVGPIDRGADNAHGDSPWTTHFHSRLATRVPCMRPGGAAGRRRTIESTPHSPTLPECDTEKQSIATNFPVRFTWEATVDLGTDASWLRRWYLGPICHRM